MDQPPSPGLRSPGETHATDGTIGLALQGQKFFTDFQ